MLGEEVYRKFPFAGTTKPMVEDLPPWKRAILRWLGLR